MTGEERNRNRIAAEAAAAAALAAGARRTADRDRNREVGHPPGQGQPNNTSVNVRWNTAVKVLKGVGKCVVVIVALLGVVWGSFAILSYKLASRPRSASPWDVWSFCVNHPDLPDSRDNERCRIIVNSTSISDLSAGLFHFTKGSIREYHKRAVGLMASYKMISAHDQVAVASQDALYYLGVLHNFGIAIYPFCIFMVYLCVITLVYNSLLRECWTKYWAFLDSLPFVGPSSWALKVVSSLLFVWNLRTAFWLFNGSQTLRRLVALLILCAVGLRYIGTDTTLWWVIIFQTITTILAHKVFLVDNLLPLYFHVVNNILDWSLWQLMVARSQEFANSRQRRETFILHMSCLRLFLLCILLEAHIDVYTLTLNESLFHELVQFHYSHCANLCAYPFRCPNDSGSFVFFTLLSAFVVRTVILLPLYYVPGQFLGVCLLLGRLLQGSLISRILVNAAQ